MSQPTFCQIILNYDQRQQLPEDTQSQIVLGLQTGIVNPLAVSVTTIVQATMTNPDAGSNLVSLALDVPECVSEEELEELLTTVCSNLDIPTAPTIEVASVMVL